MINKFQDNPILYPYQKKILRLFFSSPFSKTFYLTGGTALSAFYLAHRESQDLDLFSHKTFDAFVLRSLVKDIAEKTGSEADFQTRSESYHEVYLTNRKEGWGQKMDFIREQDKRFGDIEEIENIRIDSLINIATNKVLAVYGRLEVKDYIDLYFLCVGEKFDFYDLFNKAKEKDTGLNAFYFANAIADAGKLTVIPIMKKAFNRKKMIKFYSDLSDKLLLQAKPEQ